MRAFRGKSSRAHTVRIHAHCAPTHSVLHDLHDLRVPTVVQPPGGPRLNRSRRRHAVGRVAHGRAGHRANLELERVELGRVVIWEVASIARWQAALEA